MADVIEEGFTEILKKIEETKKQELALTEKIRSNDAVLLRKMAESVMGIISNIGMDMLDKAKQDGKGEMYDAEYYPKKMIILGKTDPIPFRPDNAARKVTDQFCVLSEEGNFFELMYSSDDFITDSYLHPISPEEVLKIYGFDAMFMLYRAMRDYLKSEEELLLALAKVLEFVIAPVSR